MPDLTDPEGNPHGHTRVVGVSRRLERSGLARSVMEREDRSRGEAELSAVLLRMLRADPGRGKNLRWMAERYAKGDFLLEDLPRVSLALSEHERVRPLLSADERDAGRFPSLAALEGAVGRFARAAPVSSGEEERRERAAVMAETETLHRDERLIVAVPLTRRAACWWGRGTKWCTAARSHNAFVSYAETGPLVVFAWPDGGKWQLHLDGKRGEIQLMDERDRPVDPSSHPDRWKDIMPWLRVALRGADNPRHADSLRRFPLLEMAGFPETEEEWERALRDIPLLPWTGVVDGVPPALLLRHVALVAARSWPSVDTPSSAQVAHWSFPQALLDGAVVQRLPPDGLPAMADTAEALVREDSRTLFFIPPALLRDPACWLLAAEVERWPEEWGKTPPMPAGHPARTPAVLEMLFRRRPEALGWMTDEERASLPVQAFRDVLPGAARMHMRWMPEALEDDAGFLRSLPRQHLGYVAGRPRVARTLFRPENREALLSLVRSPDRGADDMDLSGLTPEAADAMSEARPVLAMRPDLSRAMTEQGWLRCLAADPTVFDRHPRPTRELALHALECAGRLVVDLRRAQSIPEETARAVRVALRAGRVWADPEFVREAARRGFPPLAELLLDAGTVAAPGWVAQLWREAWQASGQRVWFAAHVPPDLLPFEERAAMLRDSLRANPGDIRDAYMTIHYQTGLGKILREASMGMEDGEDYLSAVPPDEQDLDKARRSLEAAPWMVAHAPREVLSPQILLAALETPHANRHDLTMALSRLPPTEGAWPEELRVAVLARDGMDRVVPEALVTPELLVRLAREHPRRVADVASDWTGEWGVPFGRNGNVVALPPEAVALLAAHEGLSGEDRSRFAQPRQSQAFDRTLFDRGLSAFRAALPEPETPAPESPIMAA